MRAVLLGVGAIGLQHAVVSGVVPQGAADDPDEVLADARSAPRTETRRGMAHRHRCRAGQRFPSAFRRTPSSTTTFEIHSASEEHAADAEAWRARRRRWSRSSATAHGQHHVRGEPRRRPKVPRRRPAPRCPTPAGRASRSRASEHRQPHQQHDARADRAVGVLERAEAREVEREAGDRERPRRARPAT